LRSAQGIGWFHNELRLTWLTDVIRALFYHRRVECG
jgi:hypothetical protein